MAETEILRTSDNMAPDKQLKLWELAGKDEKISISPYVWRVRLLLAHKGQSYDSLPWHFTDRDAIKPYEKVPVLEIDGKRLGESLDISKYLEEQFPEPSVFNTKCNIGNAGVDFILHWADSVMVPALFPVVLLDVVEHLTPRDQKYFKETREKMFGKTLQECVGDVSEKVKAFREVLEPLRQTVKQHKYLGGDKISYSDIAVAGNLLWCKSISKTQLLAKDDPVYEWRDRVFKHFKGTISKAHTYPV